jgi:hypothetical protein
VAAVPSRVLPAPVRRLLCDGSAALGCDPAQIGVPALVALAGAVGNSRRTRLNRSWTEPAVLWGVVVVAESGSLKSSAFDLALAPLRDRQSARQARHESDSAEHRILSAGFE